MGTIKTIFTDIQLAVERIETGPWGVGIEVEIPTVFGPTTVTVTRHADDRVVVSWEHDDGTGGGGYGVNVEDVGEELWRIVDEADDHARGWAEHLSELAAKAAVLGARADG